MKAPRQFLGLSMETRGRRRALVVGYYAVFVLLFAVCCFGIHGPSTKYLILLGFAYYFAVLLGGIEHGTAARNPPVRPFSEALYEAAAGVPVGSEPISLGLSAGGKARGRLRDRGIILDEHGRQIRDRAHYRAYSVFRWILIPAAITSTLWVRFIPPESASHLLLLMATPFAVLYLSLPQTIILWTEPDLEPEPQQSGSIGSLIARTDR